MITGLRRFKGARGGILRKNIEGGKSKNMGYRSNDPILEIKQGGLYQIKLNLEEISGMVIDDQ